MQQTNKYHITYPMRLCTATLLQGHLPRTSLTSTKNLLSRHVNGQWNVDFRAAMKLVKGSGRRDTGESCRKSVAMVREAHCALRVWGCLSW
ncbi:hypothetical protein HBH98_128130 [Parastagonospora nodorum]|nr:hypothetical protein HBH53_035410 [Parastagonospora nodorum]KAH3984724.1 hypothetical protein HBH51_025540 [Parastagonospora nodorum]KAH4036898.1 hypothetical protein HBI09_078810 [Parastagonospora nodorum]KAH4051694.1 hypothetical protein HBH49_106820 [Parastagonospora nodorum]KAH4126676.1 hypothetical protein HBH47_045150 [Parastagonospora nodorum]